MLNKRFKIAKCKTSLKLATSRIKLMKNKKGIQINQMKKELAQLLESGQDRTARIRVEHVIREEKMVAAYDLVEIYCELIVARLPIIESQKTCPIDLKEAITSVIFAAPRCSDIPELIDVRKHFTAKYGKEFVSAAIELRPDCGVSRMLVEKLSAIAPDVQTKMKVLSGVAKEHNINWDPTSFEEKESKPSDDLLNGPANIEKASIINVDPPKIQTSNVQNVHSHEENPNVPVDFSQQNKRYTLGTQNITSVDTGGIQTPSASTTHEDMRTSGMASKTMNMRQLFNSKGNDASSGRENWNMEFKDATSAAQAAAESAERASMAARAAAHLSSQGKITRQYSNESHESHIRKQPSISSSRSHSSTIRDELDVSNSGQKVGKRTGVGNPFAALDQGSLSRQSTKTSSYGDDRRDDKTDSDDDGPRFDTGFEYDEEEVKTYFPSPDRGSIRPLENTNVWSPRKNTSDKMDQVKVKSVDPSVNYDLSDDRRDDKTDSDDDGPRFDTGFEYDEEEVKTYFPSPDGGSIRPLENTNVWSPRKNTSDKMDQVKVKSVDPSVNYDLSDDQDSESENEMAKSSFSGTNKVSSAKHDLFSTRSEPAYVETSQKVKSTKSRIELNDLIERGSSIYNPEDDDKRLQSQQSSRISLKDELKNDSIGSRLAEDNSNFLNRSDDLDSGNELKFGTFIGGLRNKGGLKYPPYTKSAVTNTSPSSKKLVKESSVKIDQTSKPSSFHSRMSRLDKKKPSVSMSSSESDSDDDGDKFPVQSSKTRSQFAPPDAFFNDDGKEELPPVPKPTSASRVHLGSGLSRRTKGYVEPMAKPVISRSPKATNESQAETRSYAENFKKDPDEIPQSSERKGTEAERKYSRRSYGNKSPPEPRPHTARSKQEAFRTMPEPKISEQPLDPPKKIAESGKTEPSKTSNLSYETSVQANSVKKPSHVHPKLPDYDSLAARIQSLRTNRQ